MSVQRLRVVFRKGGAAKHISHLDLMRTWERALRRAEVPLAYSRGFNPRPKLTFASALPVGFVGRSEMLDVFLERRVELQDAVSRLRAQLPCGVELRNATEVALALPSLPSQLAAAEYEVTIHSDETLAELQLRLRRLMETESVVRSRERPNGVRTYDLRPLIHELSVARQQGETTVLRMRLQANAQGTGRADEVLSALGLFSNVRSIERARLVLKPS